MGVLRRADPHVAAAAASEAPALALRRSPGLADAFDHGRTIGSAAANHIVQRGFAHLVPDSRTEAALSRTPAPPETAASGTTSDF